MKRFLAILSSIFFITMLLAQDTTLKQVDLMTKKTIKIKLIFHGGEAIAELMENPTSLDFIALLPLSLTIQDFNKTEKIAYLPKALTHQNAPDGFTPKAGDITLYAPWGNIAIFYHGFRFSKGLIHLGHITSGLEALSKITDDTEIKVEVLENNL